VERDWGDSEDAGSANPTLPRRGSDELCSLNDLSHSDRADVAQRSSGSSSTTLSSESLRSEFSDVERDWGDSEDEGSANPTLPPLTSSPLDGIDDHHDLRQPATPLLDSPQHHSPES
jgi:hypothetical protein